MFVTNVVAGRWNNNEDEKGVYYYGQRHEEQPRQERVGDARSSRDEQAGGSPTLREHVEAKKKDSRVAFGESSEKEYAKASIGAEQNNSFGRKK